jgi:small-conductance mechanosensitive channel
MRWRKYLRRICFAGLVLSLSLAAPSYAKTPGVHGLSEPSQEDLRGLVNLLENPQKREDFVTNLKNLIQMRKAAEEKKAGKKEGEPATKQNRLPAIERLFVGIEAFCRAIMNDLVKTANFVAQTPAALGKLRAFLSEPENWSGLLKLFANTAGGVLIALIVGFLLSKYVGATWDRKPGHASFLGSFFRRFFYHVVPFAAFVGSFAFLSGLWPAFPRGDALIFTLAMILFLYRTIWGTARLLLSPDEADVRVLPLKDENANYWWIWVKRFLNFTTFYFLITRPLLILGVPDRPYLVLRALLLIAFPLMTSVFILQLARDSRARYRLSETDMGPPRLLFRRLLDVALRYWALFALAYVWTIFGFLIFRYNEGSLYILSSTLTSALLFVVLALLIEGVHRIFGKLFDLNETVKERFPGLEEKTNRYIHIARKGFEFIIVIAAMVAIAHIWGIPIWGFVTSRVGSLLILRAIAILITFGVVVIIIETSQFAHDYLLQERRGKKKRAVSQKEKTLVPMINTAVKIAVGFIGGIVILEQLGVNTTPILAGAGIVGLAVGFGSQTLVKDLINGLFILFEESIRVGDVVVLGDKGGIVEAVGLRTIKMRDLAGNVHVIPNSAIDKVINMTKTYSRYVFDVGVAYREDVDEVMAVLREIGADMQNDSAYGLDILEPLEILGVDRFEDSAVIIRARITTKPLRQWAVGREFNRRMKKTFDRRGIEIPFPHRTVYMGEPKEGSAPSLSVQLQQPLGNGKKD